MYNTRLREPSAGNEWVTARDVNGANRVKTKSSKKHWFAQNRKKVQKNLVGAPRFNKASMDTQ